MACAWALAGERAAEKRALTVDAGALHVDGALGAAVEGLTGRSLEIKW